MSTNDPGTGPQTSGRFTWLPEGLEAVTRKLVQGLPPLLGATRQDVELHFRRVLREQFERLDLCTRSEFDTQGRLLTQLQAQIGDLEKRVVALEQHPGAGNSTPPV